jgi:hypothetical protein
MILPTLQDLVVDIVRAHRAGWDRDVSRRRLVAADLVRALEPCAALPVVSAFIEDMTDFIAGQPLQCARTQQAVCSHADGLILGVFRDCYNRGLGLEALTYECVQRPSFLNATIESSAVPVVIRKATSGFDNPRYVAIFMEEMIGVRPSDLQSDKAFYFVDRFARRTMERTLPIARGLASGPVAAVFAAMNEQRAQDLATCWVWLHEHFHRSGPLPLPAALAIKSTRSGGALEELRTDLRTILGAFAGLVDPQHVGDFANFVLGERLLRYGSEGHPQADYDARSSHIFFGLLRVFGGLSAVTETLDLDAQAMRPALAAILSHVEEFEVKIASLEPLAAKQSYARFALTYVRRDPASGRISPWRALEHSIGDRVG